MESKGRIVKKVVVRANKAQTVILQDAFTRSNAASPEELKTLSEKTGLYVFPFCHLGQAFDDLFYLLLLSLGLPDLHALMNG